MGCSIKGCPGLTYGTDTICYYHKKQQDGLINPKETHYFKSKYEIECALGFREPNWDLALGELPRVKRICNNIVKWARLPIQELINESLILIATVDKRGGKFKHYLNIILTGMLKNFVAEFKNVVSYYWKPFINSLSITDIDESMSLTDDNIDVENYIIYQEEFNFTKGNIKSFKKKLNQTERVIFDYRLMRNKPVPLRVLESKLQLSKSSIQRLEHSLKYKLQRFINE